jgi:hypothetical protein
VILPSRITVAEAGLRLGETATAREILHGIFLNATTLVQSPLFRQWLWAVMHYYAATGNYARAAGIYGFLDKIAPDQAKRSKVRQALFDEVRDGCLSALGAAAFEAARNRGEALTLEEAMTLAVEGL